MRRNWAYLWRLVRRWWRAGRPYLFGALVGGLLVWLSLATRSEREADPTRYYPPAAKSPPGSDPWRVLPPPEFPLPPFARSLRDVRIVIDPGHVGQRDRGGTWRRGPTGLREAEVNLRVALFLRDFLQAVGADVILTRDRDRELGLSDAADLSARVRIANERRADLFLSIHHNGSNDPRVNYTVVFYHGNPDRSAASLSAARHLLAGLHDALRLEAHLECALLSDFATHEGNGYHVLREARVPAVLTEASFHSNPEEEARLRDPVYNRREAYGLFLGLARWAAGGLPRIALSALPTGPGGEVVISFDDGLGGRGGWDAARPKILVDTLTVRLNGQYVQPALDLPKRQIRVRLPPDLRGPARLRVDFANVFGNHVLHPELTLNLPR